MPIQWKPHVASRVGEVVTHRLTLGTNATRSRNGLLIVPIRARMVGLGRSAAPMEIIELETAGLRLRCVPAIGGCVTDFSLRTESGQVALMRRGESPLRRSSNGSSFALAPYSNRLRDARFTFEGRAYQLGRIEKHAIHGDVRDRAFRVVERRRDEVRLELDTRDVPDLDFPFPFVARMRYALSDLTLTTALTIENVGAGRMPAGGGFHPYFNRRLAMGGADPALEREVELSFRVGGVYPAGDPPLPEGPPAPVPPSQDFSTRRPLDVALDHCFAGWDGAAHVWWPGTDVSMTMKSNVGLRHLILYSPAGQPFFALEPVANANDGFNLFAQGHTDSGVVVLEPGGVLELSFDLEVFSDVARSTTV